MNETTQDTEIRARLAADDSSALDMIWNAYASDLLGYLVSLLRSRPDAEDALQEVFITIATQRTQVSQARALGPYIFRLARNVALNRMKKARRQREREQMALDWLEADEASESPDDRTHRLQKALASLPAEQRATVALKIYREKTFEEISQMLGISANTAASRYRYAIAKLKRFLEDEPE